MAKESVWSAAKGSVRSVANNSGNRRANLTRVTMTVENNGRERKSAVIVAHPGHELMIYHWIERQRPLYCCLTDGSGGRAASRVASTTRLLEGAGAVRGPICGRYSDKQIYRMLLDKQVHAFVGLMSELAEALSAAGVECVAGDATEGFNPVHDVCRILIDGAVAMVRRQTRRQLRNYEFVLDSVIPRSSSACGLSSFTPGCRGNRSSTSSRDARLIQPRCWTLFTARVSRPFAWRPTTPSEIRPTIWRSSPPPRLNSGRRSPSTTSRPPRSRLPLRAGPWGGVPILWRRDAAHGGPRGVGPVDSRAKEQRHRRLDRCLGHIDDTLLSSRLGAHRCAAVDTDDLARDV